MERDRWNGWQRVQVFSVPTRGHPMGRRSCIKMSRGTDAPICQDGRSGGFTELLARAEVCHDGVGHAS